MLPYMHQLRVVTDQRRFAREIFNVGSMRHLDNTNP